MDDTERHEEAELLAQVGRFLFSQDLRVYVQLPTALASAARAAWKRDDNGDADDGETPTDRTVQREAGALALIGLAVDQGGAAAPGDLVVVALDAWQIGSALDAADRRGMLAGLEPPNYTG